MVVSLKILWYFAADLAYDDDDAKYGGEDDESSDDGGMLCKSLNFSL